MSEKSIRELARDVVKAWGSSAALERAVMALADALEPDPAIRFDVSADGEDDFQVSLPDLLNANEHDETLCEWARAANCGDSQTFGGGATPTFTLRRIA